MFGQVCLGGMYSSCGQIGTYDFVSCSLYVDHERHVSLASAQACQNLHHLLSTSLIPLQDSCESSTTWFGHIFCTML